MSGFLSLTEKYRKDKKDKTDYFRLGMELAKRDARREAKDRAKAEKKQKSTESKKSSW